MEYLFSIAFALGMVAQAWIVMRGRWQKGDLKKLRLTFRTGVIVLILLLSASVFKGDFDVVSILLATFLFLIVMFTVQFRARLILRMSSRIVIFLTIPMLFVGLDIFKGIPILLTITIIASVIALVGGFTTLGKSYWMQVFSSTWCLLLILIAGIVYFPDITDKNISLVSTFIAGSVLFYLAIVLVPLIGLLPSKHSNLKENMQLLAYAYVWRDGDRNINILIGAFLIVTLSLNYFFEFVSNTDVVFLTLTGISFITNFSQKEFLVGDGVGDNPDS